MITVLTGGTGGAKFVDGLRQIVPPEELTIIVNTGDDLRWWGLYVSPDIDSITYMLAGKLSQERGWGVKGDTFFCLNAMAAAGTTDVVSNRRSRSGHTHFPLEAARRWQDAQRGDSGNRGHAWNQSTHPADERFARGDAGSDPGGRLEL